MENYRVIKGNNGYQISCKEWEVENPKEVFVACHGFAGDKESSAISMVASCLLKENIGTIAFDLPGHGESEVSGDCLTIDNCLDDFKCVIDYVKNKFVGVKVSVFATSYGGYLALLLSRLEDVVLERVVLRCPAIKMDEIFVREILREDFDSFRSRGYTIVGYERELKVNYSFYEELVNSKVMDSYMNGYSKIIIICGDKDTTAPIEDATLFADKFGIPLKVVKGADHRFKGAGELEKVVKYTVDFVNDIV